MTGRNLFNFLRLSSLKKCYYLKKPLHHYQVCFCHSHSSKSNHLDVSSYKTDAIRNFCIIAHVDHGKSTLADRILEHTGAISKDVQNKQVLDKLQIERERGITVKAQTATIFYKHKGKEYMLNLIDTPGHVDFSYEVSRSLHACQGALLLVDAAQGIQAQTVANFYQAFMKDILIIPVLNKIDLKSANPELVIEQMFNTFEIDPDDVLKVSAKLGTGIDELLSTIIDKVPPPPSSKENDELRALMLDTWYESKRHVVCLLQIKEGSLSKGMKVKAHYSGKTFDVKSVGVLTPDETPVETLYAGQVGTITANITDTSDVKVGDTIKGYRSTVAPLSGFKSVQPMVFAGIFPMEKRDYENVKKAINKLKLNDSSVCMTPDSSMALGFGWRMGFLGILHMEVFISRLEQEFKADVLSTVPSVPYKIHLTNKKLIKELREETIVIDNPRDWPAHGTFDETFEPIVKATIISPHDYHSVITKLCEVKRGSTLNTYSIDSNRLCLTYELPLSEIIIDFFNQLKCITSGYATFDYEDIGYRSIPVCKLDVKLNGNICNELAILVPECDARTEAKRICLKLQGSIPKHQFQITIQAYKKDVILARQDIRPIKKNVIAKCYGGDVTRKMKLIKQQAEGKKLMKMFGNIEIPRDTFINILKK